MVNEKACTGCLKEVMKIYLIAVGKRMPDWVKTGYQTYAERFPPEMTLELKEVDLVRRPKKGSAQSAIEQEGRALLSAVPARSQIIALDDQGEPWSTPTLAQHLKIWKDESQTVSLLVGGPDGLSQACLSKASRKWSLSRLTFPHPLVRVILAEQLYRAWTILTHHPYHRD